MSASGAALAIIFALVILGSATGVYAGARHKMDLEEWTVAGRGFGVVLVWLLTAGEVYTTFSFLGASGWTYSRGGPALYILSYMTLAYVVSFYILPEVWEVGRKYGMQTQSDFFQQRYGSKVLAGFVAVAGVFFIIPYIQLQLTGLGTILEIASFDGIGRAPAMVVAATLIATFVFASGVRGVAWVSIIKDVLILFVALTIGLGVPYIYFGGIGPMFAALARAKPAHLVMPGATTNLGHAWYVSTVLLTSFGFYMWPTNFAASFTARSSDTLRRNAVAMPLYTLMLPFVFFVGFAAILVAPGLRDGDLSLLTVVRKTFPPWFLGVVGGAGALTAMVPAAILILAASVLFAKNFYRPLFAPEMTDNQVARLAKMLVVLISATCLGLSIYSSTSLVSLLLLGYAGVAQFFPGVVFGLYWRRATKVGIFAGIISGFATLAILILSRHDPLFGINAGFIALCLNFAVATVLSLFMPEGSSPHLSERVLS